MKLSIMSFSFNRYQILTVVVGAHDLRKSTNLDRIGVKFYIPHPDYITYFAWNDIMLLRVTACNTFSSWQLPKQPYNKLQFSLGFINNSCVSELQLQEKVNLNNYVGWISLPKTREAVEVNTLCSVAGWGQLWTDGPESDFLMEANVHIMAKRECHKGWEDKFSFTQMMCTRGDGGSCIVRTKDDSHTLILVLIYELSFNWYSIWHFIDFFS